MDISLIIFLIGVALIALFLISTRNNPISGVILVPPFLMVVFGGLIQLTSLTEELIDNFVAKETQEILAGYFWIVMGGWALYLFLESPIKKIIIKLKSNFK